MTSARILGPAAMSLLLAACGSMQEGPPPPATFDSGVVPYDTEPYDSGRHCPVMGEAPTITGSPECPQGKGPPMIRVGAFCIDATEVTSAQYAKFLDARFPLSAQPEACAANYTFRPNKSGGNDPVTPTCPYVFDPVGKPNNPVPCVDWCDAWSFCRWAGKRLCSAPGGAVPNSTTERDHTMSEWGYACANGGMHRYPYGDTFDPNACHTIDCPKHTFPVSTASRCHGASPPFDQIYDMIGNVEEWVQGCDSEMGGEDQCAIRGWAAGAVSSYHSEDGQRMPGELQDCRGVVITDRDNEIGDSIGIRCCADPIGGVTDAGTGGNAPAGDAGGD